MNIQFLSKVALKARHMSPTALTVVGAAGVVTAAVLACRATLKAQPIIDKHQYQIQTAKELKGMAKADGQVFPYNEVVTRTYVDTSLSFVKLYALPVAIGVASIACIAGGHIVLLNRNAALGAALTATEKAFSKYRDAVKEKYGEEAERDIHYNHQVVEELDEKGKKVEVHTIDSSRSPYSRMFDESNPLWDRQPSYNQVFLISQQEYANQRLNAHGYLLLNDVYSSLGFKKTTAGAVVGWSIENGDTHVDFGMLDFTSHPRREDFANGDERSILLDFNVSGAIYQYIGDER